MYIKLISMTLGFCFLYLDNFSLANGYSRISWNTTRVFSWSTAC